jgi:hypothetical protein
VVAFKKQPHRYMQAILTHLSTGSAWWVVH